MKDRKRVHKPGRDGLHNPQCEIGTTLGSLLIESELHPLNCFWRLVITNGRLVQLLEVRKQANALIEHGLSLVQRIGPEKRAGSGDMPSNLSYRKTGAVPK